MKKQNFTYEKSGVNINAADNFVKYISNISLKNKDKNKLSNIGGFGSISSIPKNFKTFIYYSIFLKINLKWG